MSSARPKSTSSASRGGGRSYAKPTHNSRPNSRAQQLIEQQQATEKRQIVGQYMLGKTIGEGTFGKVKLAAHMPTGEKVSLLLCRREITIIDSFFSNVSGCCKDPGKESYQGSGGREKSEPRDQDSQESTSSQRHPAL
jgi:serine/threonine protein kinase